MPGTARIGDICSGHACFPPTSIMSGSPNVFVNSIAVARVGDTVLLHGCGNCPPHPRNIAKGSSSVFVNGIAVARIGDAISCGGSVSAGSGNVIIGG